MTTFLGTDGTDTIVPGFVSPGVEARGPGATPGDGEDTILARAGDDVVAGVRNGTLRQEVVQAYGSSDMGVFAITEHGHGEVGGLPAQDWPLRVTLVYRREGAERRLAHRHADPLVRGISLEESAALAAGTA